MKWLLFVFVNILLLRNISAQDDDDDDEEASAGTDVAKKCFDFYKTYETTPKEAQASMSGSEIWTKVQDLLEVNITSDGDGKKYADLAGPQGCYYKAVLECAKQSLGRLKVSYKLDLAVIYNAFGKCKANTLLSGFLESGMGASNCVRGKFDSLLNNKIATENLKCAPSTYEESLNYKLIPDLTVIDKYVQASQAEGDDTTYQILLRAKGEVDAMKQCAGAEVAKCNKDKGLASCGTEYATPTTLSEDVIKMTDVAAAFDQESQKTGSIYAGKTGNDRQKAQYGFARNFCYSRHTRGIGGWIKDSKEEEADDAMVPYLTYTDCMVKQAVMCVAGAIKQYCGEEPSKCAIGDPDFKPPTYQAT